MLLLKSVTDNFTICIHQGSVLLASASLDYVALGAQTGKIMAKIIKGEVKASNDIAISVEDSFNCYSAKVATLLGITLPDLTNVQNVD